MSAQPAVEPVAAMDRPKGKPWPIREAAAFLGVSEKSLRRHVEAGKVAAIRIVGRVLIADETVRRLAAVGTA